MSAQRLFPVVVLLLAYNCFLNPSDAESLSCEDSTNELRGAGSSFPALLYQEIGSKYAINRLRYDRKVNYVFERKNSGYGKARITLNIKGNGPVLFGATESLLGDKDRDNNSDLITFPVLAGAVVVIYNLPEINNLGNETLAVSTQSLVGIYNGTIREWDDPILQGENPSITLPHKKIRVVGRSDTAGDTDIFTHALGEFDPQWVLEYGDSFLDPAFVGGECCNSTKWPPNVIEFFGNRVTGMVGVVGSIPYTIGYAAYANVKGFDVPIADLINKAKTRTSPSIHAVQAAMEYHFSHSDGSLLFRLSDALHPDAYPIASFSYLIVNSTTHQSVSCCQAVELSGFIDTVLNEMDSFERHSLVPLSLSVANQIRHSVLSSLTCNKQNTYQLYLASMEIDDYQTRVLQMVVGGVSAVALIVMIVGSVYIWKMRQARLADETKWIIPTGTIRLVDQQRKVAASHLSLQSLTTSRPNSAVPSTQSDRCQSQAGSIFGRGSRMTIGQLFPDSLLELKYIFRKGEFDHVPVFLAPINLGHPTQWRQESKRLFRRFKESVTHHNVFSLMGFTMVGDQGYTVLEYGEKGTLHFMLQTCRYELTDSHKFNMACDIAKGMKYLHRKGLVHGLLSSITCYVDNSWSIKIALWERFSLSFAENPKEFNSQIRYKEELRDDVLIRLLYLDPEIFCSHRQSFDIYSFGMILIEIFTQKLPFFEQIEEGTTSYTEILKNKFFNYNAVPSLDESWGISTSILQMIAACTGSALNRPSFADLQAQLHRANPSRKGIVDVMMETMENYMETLETKVKERTFELQEITNRMEVLLHEVLPPQIAEKMFRGETVPPEFFECATVYFSDIVGFTTISSKSSPMEVMSFLNDLWVAFDNTIDQFDVYKVDTIGDAYMVCSGLPQRNGITHVKHIADLAFALLEACATFQIRHMPEETLKIRIGINSGRVTAGIVGTKMPQYCVFGDTVNTASRMESTSLPLHIQVSESTHELLKTHFPKYKMTARGNLDVKGKGNMKTYWLHPPAPPQPEEY